MRNFIDHLSFECRTIGYRLISRQCFPSLCLTSTAALRSVGADCMFLWVAQLKRHRAQPD
eukprot:scaffold674585_cov79-Prasinocladus_malaysianus.AAC.1